MDWCSILECYDYFHLVDNIQQQVMVYIFRYINYFVSNFVEELDNKNKKITSMFTKIE